MMFLWNVLMSPIRLLCNIYHYYKYDKLSKQQYSMHIDRMYHKRMREEHMVSIQDDIPYVLLYIVLQLIWSFIL